MQRMLEDPLVKQAVADLRRAIRVKALEGVQVLTPAIYQRLAATVDHGAAKDIDALSRAALNLEKTAASASGENRPQAAQPPAVVQVAIAPGWGKPKPEMVALLASKGFQTVVDGEVLEPEPEPKP